MKQKFLFFLKKKIQNGQLKMCLSCIKTKFAGQKLFSVFGPAMFFKFKSETNFRL